MPDRLTTLRLLRKAARDVVREVGRMPADAVLWRPLEREWSVHECLTHIRDIERAVFLHRLQRTLAEDKPALEAFDEVTYQREHWNADEPLDGILADFLNARAEIVNLLGAADWSRVGLHAARGPISLAWQADYTLAHTWEHLSQIMRVRLEHATAKDVGQGHRK